MSNEAVKTYRTVKLKAPGIIESISVNVPLTTGVWVLLVLFSTTMAFVPNAFIESITSSLTTWAKIARVALEVYVLQSVNLACAYHAATTLTLEDVPANARLFAEIHNLAVTSDPNTILTWERVYKHCLEKLPHLMAGVTLANFSSVAFTSFENFIAYGLQNGILHFSEVTYCVALLGYMDKLPLYIISNDHFWLAIYSIISHATGPISIAATYEFLRNLSSHPCLPASEFWALVHNQLVDHIQYLMKVGDIEEMRQLVQILCSVNWPPVLMMWNYFIYFWMFLQGVVVFFIGLIIYKGMKYLSNKKPKYARKWKELL